MPLTQDFDIPELVVRAAAGDDRAERELLMAPRLRGGMTPIWHPGVEWWVSKRIPDCPRGFGECRSLGIVNGQGDLVAGVVFHDWWPERGTIELSVAADDPRWATRTVLRSIAAAAFNVARLIIARNSVKNIRARRMWNKCGARETIIPELYDEGEAGAIHTLTEPMFRTSDIGGEK